MGDADPALQDLVELALVQQLGVPGLLGLELHGHLLSVGDVDGQVDVAEGAGADLAHQLVLAADDELGLGAAAARHPAGPARAGARTRGEARRGEARRETRRRR